MAVLPTKFSLSQPQGFVTGRPIASQDTSGLARGVESLGQDLSSIGTDIQQQRDTVDIATAEAKKNQGLIGVTNDFQKDGDYASFSTRAPVATQGVVASAAESIRNPAMRAKWLLGAGTDAVRTNDAINDHAFLLGQQAQKVSLGNANEINRNIIVDPNTTEDQKNKAKADIQGANDMALKAGLLTPAEKEASDTQYLKNADPMRAKLLADTNPAMVNGWNPNKPGATPQDGPTPAWLEYDNKGATRSQPLSNNLKSAMDFLPSIGVTMKVFSGGQDEDGPDRTGSHRHDHGNAADVFFYKDGKKLDWNNPQDVPVFQSIVEQAKANGVTGFGAGPGYMQPGSMHVGFGTPSVWGAGGSGDTAPDWLKTAYAATGATPSAPGAATDAINTQKPVQVASNAPDWFKAMPPEDQQLAYQVADTKIKQQQVEAKGNIEQVIQDAPVAVTNTGTYDGVTPTHQQFVDAYGQQGDQKFQEFSAALDVGHSVYNFRTESNDDIQKTVEQARPVDSGEGAALETKKYEALSTAATQALAARKADPATYVRQAFPSVDKAWNDAATSGNYAAAMTATATAQQQLGIKDMQLLPKSVAEQSVATFKQPDIPDNQRLGAVSSLIFSTPNNDQRRAVFNQLVDAGLPAMTEGALEAAARGDTGAANRLMQAALVDPAKLVKSGDVKPADIDSTIYSNVWEPGAVGDAAYGVSYGDAASLERAQRGSDLMKRAVSLRVSQGEDLQTAVDGAKKDLFGDVKVYNGEGGVTANLPVPTDTDTSMLTAGLDSAKTSFKAALDLQRERILSGSKIPAGDGTRAVLDATTQNRMNDILENGVYVQTGSGVGLRDPYTGQFVPGADGVTPLSIPLDKVLDMGRANPFGGNDAAARFNAGQANTGLVQPAPVQQYLKGKPVDQNDTSSAASQWMRGQPVTAK